MAVVVEAEVKVSVEVDVTVEVRVEIVVVTVEDVTVWVDVSAEVVEVVETGVEEEVVVLAVNVGPSAPTVVVVTSRGGTRDGGKMLGSVYSFPASDRYWPKKTSNVFTLSWFDAGSKVRIVTADAPTLE